MGRKLCVIPARGGSKRLPRKNVLSLAGRPLVAHSIEIAKRAGIFDRIILSTDDEEIEEVGKQWGADIYKRPPEFATDNIGVIPALVQLMETLSDQGEKYDFVCQTLPTSVGKLPRHFSDALRSFESDTDSVVSVSPYNFPLAKALKILPDGGMKPYLKDSPLLTGTARTQDQAVYYHDNGAMYWSRWESFMKYGNFYRGKVKGYELESFYALDIDDEYDFAHAEMLLEYAAQKPNSVIGKAYSELLAVVRAE